MITELSTQPANELVQDLFYNWIASGRQVFEYNLHFSNGVLPTVKRRLYSPVGVLECTVEVVGRSKFPSGYGVLVSYSAINAQTGVRLPTKLTGIIDPDVETADEELADMIVHLQNVYIARKDVVEFAGNFAKFLPDWARTLPYEDYEAGD